jgi:alkyldihydroxyacetonephosphate synthase
MRWWGWGDPAHPVALEPRTLAFLRDTLAISGAARPPVALERVAIEPSAIPPTALAALRDVMGAEHVRTGHVERVTHAAGKGYPDLVRLRAGQPEGAPDAVAYPRSREQLRALLHVCAEHSLALVPFGGGTSVVGGVAPVRGEQRAVLTLDLARLCDLVRLDRQSRTVTVGAGMRAVELERALARKRLTLGHFPQSYEYVSLGGCAATRSAGQASTGYGRFERMVLGLSLCAPAGTLATSAVPASAAGPNLRELIVGSEGVLGVIDELTLRVRHAPEERSYEGAFFETFDQGVQALREMAQRGLSPQIARLSDAPETRVSLELARHGGTVEWLGRRYLGVRGYREGCLAIFGLEGARGTLRSPRRRLHALVRAHGGLVVGKSPGRAWQASRFSAPYLRDGLLTHGVLVETLETATSWSNLQSLHRRVGSAIAGALRACGTPGLIGCHVSHVYETGASLYFTLLAPQLDGREIEQWQAVKRAACDAIVDGGGTISHHHAVGRDHVPWIERELGRDGVQALRALKDRLDPAGVMNPGKLLG